ncbi:hypothetical protein B6I21_01060 [candidate division KSB1 bacterium 4572_119]|nr:MAG: hypothetical protein B6I21_01060 [candidate division KSB1 bacterium 4572_119]
MFLKKCRVLLIEDDLLDQIAFKRVVENNKLNYEYKIAGNVVDAKRLIKSGEYDVIITDYNLGDGTLFDFIDIIKGIPIIVTTGAGGEDVAVTAMKKGAYDYLIKDIHHNYLKVLPVIINNAIEHKITTDQIHMLSHAMMAISDSVYITDMNDKIIFVNKAFVETYHYSKKEILNKTPVSSFAELQESRNGLADKVEPDADKDFNDEFVHCRKNGENFSVSLSLSFLLNEKGEQIAKVYVARDITERKKVEEEMRTLVVELQEALDKVKILSGFLPICSSCKRIRDDKGYWNQIEKYIKDHSEAEFSHSLCPECITELYPDLDIGKE